MQSNYIWLTASCFCSRARWGELLHEIKNFRTKLDHEKYVSFQIQFNDTLGDNIRVSILPTPGGLDEVGQSMEEYFGRFFSGFNDGSITSPIQGIFLPFPTNRIEFGLYNIAFDERMFPTYKTLEEMSELIIEALQHEEITEDTLISFCFYLQIAFIKTCLPYYEQDIDALFLALSPGNDNSPGAVLSREELERNSDLMQEITSDVMDQDHFDDNLEWLNRWINFCRSCLTTNMAGDSEEKMDTRSLIRNLYQTRIAQIHDQLGLSKAMKVALHHLTIRTLWSFYK